MIICSGLNYNLFVLIGIANQVLAWMGKEKRKWILNLRGSAIKTYIHVWNPFLELILYIFIIVFSSIYKGEVWPLYGIEDLYSYIGYKEEREKDNKSCVC